MKTIDQVLTENEFKIRQLLRRSRVIGAPNMETIERAFNKHGEPFMLKLLEIITPTESSFTALIQPKAAFLSSGSTVTGLMPMNTATTGKTTGKAWSFWDNLLNAVNKTGETIKQFKVDATGNPIQETEYQPAEIAAQNTSRNMVYVIAAAFVAFLLILLILKK